MFRSTGNCYFEGTAKSIGGSVASLTFDDLIINGTYTNNLATLIVVNDLEGTGTLTNGANNTLELRDDVSAVAVIGRRTAER